MRALVGRPNDFEGERVLLSEARCGSLLWKRAVDLPP